MRTLYVALGLFLIVPAASRAEAQSEFDAAEQALDADPTFFSTAHAPSDGPVRYRLLSERLRTKRLWGPALMTALGFALGVALVLTGFVFAIGEIDCEDDCTNGPFGMVVGGGVAGAVGIMGALFLIIRAVNRNRWRRELRAIESGSYALASPP